MGQFSFDCETITMISKVLSLLLVASYVSSKPQLPAFPNPAHTFLANPAISAAHPNPAHTSALEPSQSAHPNPAHTFARADCARFSGAFPCAPGDDQCAQEYKLSGCGRK